MKRIIFIIVACLLGSASKPAAQSPPVAIEADYAIFRSGGSGQAYVEIFYAIPRQSLNYVPIGADSLGIDLLMRVNISSGDSLWAADMWRTSHRIAAADSTSPNVGQRVVNAIRYPIQPGAHTVKLFARDLHGESASDSAMFTVDFSAGAPGELALSSLELASAITPEPKANDDIFYKNAMRVMPNPSAIFGMEQPMVFYYLEIYNLQQHVSGATYRTRAYVADAKGAPVPAIKPREHKKSVIPSTVEVGALNVSNLASGTYSLHFDLFDAEGALLKSTSKKLYVYNPQLEAAAEEVSAEADSLAFAGLVDEVVAKEIEVVRYLYTEPERQIAQTLKTPGAKRAFLGQFWRRYGRSRNAPWKPLRDKYLSGVAYASETYRSFAREGWATDRGRVYLLYGRPDDVESFPSTDQAKPHEIWTYNSIEGGVVFIFGDRTGFREFQLLHSTKIGEIQNDNWQSQIEAR